jgi:nucleotide-binding universal stress UspA family protein
MFHRILVPLDGSRRAESSIPVAARLARATHGTIMLMRSVEPLTPYGPYLSEPVGPASTVSSQQRDLAASYLTQVLTDEALSGLKAVTRVTEGPAAESILTLCQAEQIDLVVLCAHGMTGYHRWRLGGVAQHVVRHAPTPVLLLNEFSPGSPAKQIETVRRALIPLDGSSLAEAAIAPAIQLMAALAPQSGRLRLLRIISPYAAEEQETTPAEVISQANQQLQRLVEQLRAAPTEQLHLAIDYSVILDADPAERILSVSEPPYNPLRDKADQADQTAGYDVIVMATHGRTGVLRWALGSITERVLQATGLPLLIVRPIVEQPALAAGQQQAAHA